MEKVDQKFAFNVGFVVVRLPFVRKQRSKHPLVRKELSKDGENFWSANLHFNLYIKSNQSSSNTYLMMSRTMRRPHRSSRKPQTKAVNPFKKEPIVKAKFKMVSCFLQIRIKFEAKGFAFKSTAEATEMAGVVACSSASSLSSSYI